VTSHSIHPDPHLVVQVALLELDPDPLPQLGPVQSGVEAEHADGAAVGRPQPLDDLDGGGLPAPLGPMIPKISPRSTVKDTSWTATVSR
jgi:hypothetical protein